MGLFKRCLAKIDNTQFANISNFNSSKLYNSLYLIRNNILKLSKKEQDNSENLELDIIVIDNFESKLSNIPKKEPLQINSGSIEISCQLMQTRTLFKLYPNKITYRSIPILIELLDNLNQLNLNLVTLKTPLNLAQFTSTHIPQSYVYMVQILKMLKSNVNNK